MKTQKPKLQCKVKKLSKKDAMRILEEAKELSKLSEEKLFEELGKAVVQDAKEVERITARLLINKIVKYGKGLATQQYFADYAKARALVDKLENMK